MMTLSPNVFWLLVVSALAGWAAALFENLRYKREARRFEAAVELMGAVRALLMLLDAGWDSEPPAGCRARLRMALAVLQGRGRVTAMKIDVAAEEALGAGAEKGDGDAD